MIASEVVDAVCFGIYGMSSKEITADAFLSDLRGLERRWACTAGHIAS